MKILRPAFPRGVGSCFSALFSTTILGALAVSLVKLVTWMERMEHPRKAISPASEQAVIGLVMAVFGVLAVLAALFALFSLLATRYEVGATELKVQSGALWRRTVTHPLLSITRIETVSGPLMRLFGLTDLRVFEQARPNMREWPFVTLRGLRDGEEIRRLLLDRRASLHEAALRGDLMVGNTPQEIHLQRLSEAIERLNQRLPRA